MKRILIHFIYFISFLMFGCNPFKGFSFIDSLTKSSPYINGSVPGISISSSSTKQISKNTKKYDSSVSVLSCTNPLVMIYQLDSNDQKLKPEIGSGLINSDGTFKVQLANEVIQHINSSFSVNFQIAVEGCSENLTRPLTGLNNQIVSRQSTLLEKLTEVNVSGKKNLTEVFKNDVSDLIHKLENVSGNNLPTIFTNTQSDPNLTGKFLTLFNFPISELSMSVPDLNSVTSVSTLNELQSGNFGVSASHWHPDYTIAYLWKLDSIQVSTTANYVYTPTKISQGLHTLELFVGRSDGLGGIDLSKKYFQRVFSVRVNDTFQPIAPALGLISDPVTNNQNVTLSLTTGTGQSECDSFVGLALTDNDPVAPVNPTAYSIACTNAPTQMLNYTLSTAQGLRTLRVWARDNAGNVSATPTTVNVMFDTAIPAISLTSFNSGNFNGGSNQNITWSASDNVSLAESPIQIEYSGNYGGSWSVLSSLESHDGTYAWTMPNVDISQGLIRLTATDSAGNSNSVVSTNTFLIDSTNPSVNITANPTILNNSTSASFSFSGTDSGSGIASYECQINSGGYSSCTSPKNYTGLTEGVHNFNVRSIDQVGHISNVESYSWTLDTTVPILTISSSPPSITNSTTGIFSFNANDSGGAVVASYECQINGSIYSPCSSPKSFSGLTQGTQVVNIRALDTAGNISVVSSYSWVIDLTNPTVEITLGSKPSNPSNQTALNFQFTASDVGGGSISGFECRLDGGVYTSCVSPYALTGLSDGSHTFFVRTTDTAGNVSVVDSHTWVIDATAPIAPVIARSSDQYSSQTQVNITVSCIGDYSGILFQESAMAPTSNDPAWEPCQSTKSYNLSVSAILTNGTKTIFAFTKDILGNVSIASSTTVVYDTMPPVISLTNFNNGSYKAGSTQNITWTANDATSGFHSTSVKIDYSTDNGSNWIAISAGTSHDGTEAWTLPVLNNAMMKLKLTAIDRAGHVASVESANTFIIDSIAPTVTQLQFNSGTTNSFTNSIISSMQANDNLSLITQFCFKYNSAVKPSELDNCWKDVNAPLPGISPAQSISFSNYFYQIGFSIGSYIIYSWAKDSAGNISNNTNTLNVDRFVIYFDPGTPPSVSALQVSNSDLPTLPLVESDFTVTSGNSIYIKWNASDIEGLHANPISIYYTTDDSTFILLSGGANLLNAVNGSCALSVGFTGCAVLSAPVSGYFKIRLVVKDLLQTTVFANAIPFNNGKLRILAGNTETGLGGSAKTAILSTYSALNGADYSSKNKLVISEDGKIFYHDSKGLLWIDPATAKLDIFIPVTGTSSGDGGSISSATLNNVQAISLTATNDLLIWDYDRVRKVDLENLTISTLFGGGGQSDPTGVVSANSISLSSGFNRISGTFIALPNGDVLFTSPAYTFKHRRFRAIDQQIVPMTTSGVGYTGDALGDWSIRTPWDLGISFNTTSSQINFMTQGMYISYTGDAYPRHARIDPNSGSDNTPYTAMAPYNLPFTYSTLYTGLDGKLYFIDRFKRALHRYNTVDNSSTLILGTGGETNGMCSNGTLATNCASEIDTFFVSKNSQVYFTDRGSLRTINESDQVITLFGQYYAEGHNADPRLSRFGNLNDLNFGKTVPGVKKINVLDSAADRYREFEIDGNLFNIATIGFYWGGPWSFEVDSNDGDILAPKSGNLQRYDRDTQSWSTVVGGGGTAYYDSSANGLTGNNINLVSGYNQYTLGFLNNILFYSKYYWTGSTAAGCYIRGYQANDSYRQLEVMGGDGSCTSNITVGQPMNLQNAENSTKLKYFKDPTDNVDKYFYAQQGTHTIFRSTLAGTVSFFATLSHNMNSFTYNFNGDGLNLYYCSTGNNKLYKYIYNTGVTTELTWGSPTTKCDSASRGILYDSDRNSIIFIFKQNNLFGVSEYNLNP